MNNIFYDIEDNCYRTYPDGDRANNKEIHKSIQKLQKEKQELKKQLEDLLNQQKEFIKWLEHELDISGTNASRYYYFLIVLSKYNEIMGGK